MSKACLTFEEAEDTVKHYAAKEQPARIEKDEVKNKKRATSENRKE